MLERIQKTAPKAKKIFRDLTCVMRGSLGSVWLLFALLMLACGCTPFPEGQPVVDRIEIRGTQAVSERQLKKLLATRETPRFLGLLQGVFFDYYLYNQYVLQTDIQRIERIYRAHGYYHAQTRAAEVFIKGDHVRVVVEVDEGPATTVESLIVQGISGLSDKERRKLHSVLNRKLKQGQVFQEQEFDHARDAVLHELRSAGYAYAEVKQSANVDLQRNRAHLSFDVTPHDKAVYGTIEIRGLAKELPEKMLRRVLMLRPGQQYDQRKLDDAQNAALALGVFSSVQIEPQLSQSGPTKEVPLVVRVTPAPLRAVKLGAGLELDVIRAAAHGKLGWRSQNFLGGLRDLSFEAKPGVVFFPTRLQALVAPTDLLPALSAQARLRQPQLLEARTDGILQGSFDMYPLLLSPHVDPKLPVLGYRELVGSFSLERAFSGNLFVSPQYSLQGATPFTYRGQLDPDLRSLLISSVELFGRYDTRDDRSFPSRGFLLNGSVEYAGLGGQVEDVRVLPELRVFFPLGPHWTLATRVGTGLLFPINWGGALGSADGSPPPGVDRTDWVRDTQISQFRSFFAGGPNSNRGYAARGIGPHGVIPFYLPGVNAPDAASACAQDPQSNPATCLLPLGGRSMWEASVEVRFPIHRALYGAAFCDAADVAPQVLTYRFDRPHLSCGAGVRYSTPIGPLRFDVGYRIPGMQTLGSSSAEGVPPSLFGAPLALALSIGEAF